MLLHGFGDTGDMWAPLAAVLVKDHTVIVPDLRGMGLSSHPDDRLRQENPGAGHRGVLDALKIEKADLVTHDIGNMVGYAFAAQYPDRVTQLGRHGRAAAGHRPVGRDHSDPTLWHFNFRGPDVERLVAGRERIYLDRFYNELSADPKAIDEATREHYAAALRAPAARCMMRSSSSRPSRRTPSTTRSSCDARQADHAGARHRRGEILRHRNGRRYALRRERRDTARVIPNSGHWLMEEQPAATIAAIRDFLGKK